MNLKLFILVLLLLLILIFLILININFKENFVCIKPTKIDTDKICNSSFKMIFNKNFLNNNTTNGYIQINYKDKFKNDGSIYYKCVDNWDGSLKDFNKAHPDELNKNQYFDKLKKDNNSLGLNFSNLQLYKCNKTCPKGKGIKDNSNTCLDCDDDEYNMGDSHLCKKYNNNCPKLGYLKSKDQKTGIINCNPCYPGTYSDIEYANNCKSSKPGYYVNKYGQSNEKPCELGTYSNTLGSKNCIKADKGYYIDLTGQTTAKPCELGTYSNTLGSISCTPAEKGYYIDLTGQTTAKPCELGTYSDTLGNITCSPADIGYYVDDIGQITAKPCSIDETTNTYGSKSINSCLPIFIENTQWIYDIPGTYQWTCPPGITKISVVAVGGGGGGNRESSRSSGGGGGGLIWVNNIIVKPGKDYTITVGKGGDGKHGQDGGDTIFIDNGNELLFKAHGGQGGKIKDGIGSNGGSKTIYINGHIDYGGGNGGQGGGYADGGYCGGGGGAGGYTGNGGNGNNINPGNDGIGGGGGGGVVFDGTGNAAPGGGVGIYGEGDNGQGGVVSDGSMSSPYYTYTHEAKYDVAKGKSGSGGIEAINDPDGGIRLYRWGQWKRFGGFSNAGKYGGGGGGMTNYLNGSSNGANGALRIIYHPKASFPTTKVSNSDYQLTYTNENGTSSAI